MITPASTVPDMRTGKSPCKRWLDGPGVWPQGKPPGHGPKARFGRVAWSTRQVGHLTRKDAILIIMAQQVFWPVIADLRHKKCAKVTFQRANFVPDVYQFCSHLH